MISRITLFFIAALLLVACSWPQEEGSESESSEVIEIETNEDGEKQSFFIETKKVGEFDQNITITKSGILEGASSIDINAQASGHVDTILVKAGDTVAKGQILIKLSDTVASYGLSLGQASTSLQAARLNYEQTSIVLDRAIIDTQTAYDKALADLLDTNRNTKETVAQAERNSDNVNLEQKILNAKLELDNLERSNNETLNSYENSIQNEHTKLTFFLQNVIDTIDSLLGVSDQYKYANDTFEDELGARNSSAVLAAEWSLRSLIANKKSFDSGALTGTLESRISKLQWLYDEASRALTAMEQVLIFSISSDDFTDATIATHRATIDSLQLTHQTNSATLVVFLNQAQSFLRTYEQTFDDKEQDFLLLVESLQTWSGNTDSALLQARIWAGQSVRAAQAQVQNTLTALENAKKNKDVTLRQLSNQIRAAQISTAQASVQAGRLNIKSPIDGTIGAIMVDAGEELFAGKPAVSLSSQIAQFSIHVDQWVISSVEAGQVVDVTYKWEQTTGTITSVSPIADQSLNYVVKIKVDTPVDFLGDFIEASLPVTSEFVVLPLEHVRIISQSQWQIWTFADGEVNRKNIILGNIWGDVVEVTSWVSEDDVIITSDMTNFNEDEFTVEEKE